jgi:hypothetical protein
MLLGGIRMRLEHVVRLACHWVYAATQIRADTRGPLLLAVNLARSTVKQGP